MTLKEKLEQYIDPQIDVIHLEKIADDYAIEFAEWITQQPKVKIIKKSGLDNYYMKMSSKELLGIFKKEKGL